MILNVRRIFLLQSMRQSLLPHIHLEGRPGEWMFHFHATLLSMHNAKLPAGFLPYFIMHDRETTAVPSPSSKPSISRRKWGDWRCGRNTEALALATELTWQKETNCSKNRSFVLFCFPTPEIRIRKEGEQKTSSLAKSDRLEVQMFGPSFPLQDPQKHRLL